MNRWWVRWNAFGATLYTFLALISSPVQAQEIAETSVFIRCTTTPLPNPAGGPAGEPFEQEGSGVVISPEGYVLTAGHLVWGDAGVDAVKRQAVLDRTKCEGVLGSKREGGSDFDLNFEKGSIAHDAAVLRISIVRSDYEFLQYCRIYPENRRANFLAAGYPLGASSGPPSLRRGILSSTYATAGLLQTDILTTQGMSGGMVMLEDSEKLFGLVIANKFGQGAIPEFFGILYVHLLQGEFGVYGLTEAPKEDCTPRTRVVGPMTYRLDRSGEQQFPLPFTLQEGYCFISYISGAWTSRESAGIVPQADGQLILEYENYSPQGKEVGVTCLRI